MRREDELGEHVAEVLSRAAASALAEGSASLERDFEDSASDLPASVELRPTRTEAAPLVVAVDSPGEAYIDVGRHGTHFELWEKPGPSFDHALAGIAEAVVHGRYEEWVRLGRGGRFVAAKGVFHEEDGQRRVVTHNTLGVLVERRPGWAHVRYSAYA